MGGVASEIARKSKAPILTPDRRLLDACEALRYAVEHPNERSDIIQRNGIFTVMTPDEIMIVKVDGVVIGYKVHEASRLEISPFFDRYVYIKVPGHRLTDLSRQEMRAIQTAIMEAFFEHQQGEVKVEVIGYDAMLFRQRFQVAFPVERNPNLVTIAGGFG